MKILVDIGHPAHVHLLRNLIAKLKARGHTIVVTVKSIESAKALLHLYGIDYIELGAKSNSLGGKMISQLRFDLQLYKLVKKHRIDLMIGTSITIAHVTKLSGISSIVFDDDDDEVQPLMVKFGHPFASLIVSPDTLLNKRKKKATLYYPSYHELAYLHPKRFKPDPNVINELGLKPDETFFVLRFNAFNAHHDIGVKGLTTQQKRAIIGTLARKGKVFITTESAIDREFSKYALKIAPDKIHSLLYYATMLIGESQTMTSEAAVLGTPSLRINSFAGRISYLEEEEHRYGLTFGFKPDQFPKLMDKLNELLEQSNLKQLWQKKREKLLSDKIDSTAFYLWLVEHYRKPFNLSYNPEFWKNFN